MQPASVGPPARPQCNETQGEGGRLPVPDAVHLHAEDAKPMPKGTLFPSVR